MTGQNDRQDRSLTGQVRDQAGHCPNWLAVIFSPEILFKWTVEMFRILPETMTIYLSINFFIKGD